MPSRGYLNFEYKPISLNEWLAPAMMATQYQRELEDKYLQLQSEVNAWDKIKANEQDSQLYENIYKPYIDAINNGVNELTSHGSNPNSRRRLYALTSQYNQVIKPIEEAYAKREQEQSKWREAQYKNPELIIEREPNTYSLEDFMNGTYTSPQIIDKGQVYKNALTSFQPLAKAIRKSPEWIQNHGYWEIRTQKGYTPDEVKQAILNPESADPMLRSAVENVISSSNASNWSNPENAIEAITPVVNQALTYAIGSADTEYKADLEYQHALDMSKMAYKARLDNAHAAYVNSLKPPKDSNDDKDAVTGRYPTVNTEYPGLQKQHNDAWDTNGITYSYLGDEWVKNGKIITNKKTKDLYNQYKKAYPYLKPEQAIQFGSALDQTMSLTSDTGAQYTTKDGSYKTTVDNFIRNMRADSHNNFYNRKGNPIDWSEFEDLKDDDVQIAMDSNGLHIKINGDWYDSMKQDGTITAKHEISAADKYVKNVYTKLSDFSDGGVEISSQSEINGLLEKAKTLPGSKTLKHIRFRATGDNSHIYNMVYDTSNGRYYMSDSYDILNGGDDFSDTMNEMYQIMLYDVMSSFNGPKTE